MKFCPFCGKQVEDNHKFCYHCGSDMTFSGGEADSEPAEETQQNISEGTEPGQVNWIPVTGGGNAPLPPIGRKKYPGKILGIIGGAVAAVFLLLVIVSMFGDSGTPEEEESLFLLEKGISDDEVVFFIDYDEDCDKDRLQAVEERIKAYDSGADISVSDDRITVETDKSLYTKHGEERKIFGVDGSIGLVIESLSVDEKKVYEIDKDKIYVIEKGESHGSTLGADMSEMDIIDKNISMWSTANDVKDEFKVQYIRLVVEEEEAKKITAVIEKSCQYAASVLAVSDCYDLDSVYGGTELGTVMPAPRISEEGYVDFYIFPSDMTSSETTAAISKILENPIYKGKMKTTVSPKLCGFMDEDGEIVIDFEYEGAGVPSEGMIAVEKNGKWGFIDNRGKEKIDFLYDGTVKFKNGLAAVKKGEKWGMVNKKGKVKIDFKYEQIRYFDEGVVTFKQGGKWGFMDKGGKVKVKNRYDDMGDFSDGIVAVKKAGKWGGIDAAGNTVIPFEYDEKFSYDAEAPTLVCKNGKYGYIDKNGNTVIPFNFKRAKKFSEGKAAVQKDDKYGYIDTTGETVIPFKYVSAYTFSDGVTFVSEDFLNPAIIIDESGSKVAEVDAWLTEDFKNGLALVYDNDNTEYYVDKYGERVGPAFETYQYE